MKLRIIVILIIFGLVFSSCVYNKIIEQNDIVNSTKRIELKFSYDNQRMGSPLLHTKKSFVKKMTETDTIFELYDVLIMNSTSYRLEDKVFVLIKDKVFSLEIEQKEYENSKEIKEKREDVETSDSTTMSVVTGYSENNRKITRFMYILPGKLIEEIKNTDNIQFRYYSGPDMITVSLRGNKLKKLKEMISRK